ncbi:MAG TPA: SCO family protein [Acidobacteriota bacterium]|nr:SCO family protein [Acidobacteriota bacterium]
MRNATRLLSSVIALAAACMAGPIAEGVLAQSALDPHAEHHHMSPGTTRILAEYSIPQVKLVRADGKTVSLPEELNDGRPVVLNFIFTTCTTICPVMSQTFARLEKMLGAERGKVHLVSITLDPEEDTPARLTEYARRLQAGPEWQYYTGTVQAIKATEMAFGLYIGNKMTHTPLTLLRTAPGKPWLRINGFATADDLLWEIRNHDMPAE